MNISPIMNNVIESDLRPVHKMTLITIMQLGCGASVYGIASSLGVSRRYAQELIGDMVDSGWLEVMDDPSARTHRVMSVVVPI